MCVCVRRMACLCRKRGSGFGGPCLLSEELQKFVGEETMSRSQVVKCIWDYIKVNNLQVRHSRGITAGELVSS